MVVLKDFFKKLLSKFTKKIELSIESNFTKGSIRVLTMANREDLKPVPPTNKEKELLTGQVYENIQGVNAELSKQIKNAIRNSILEKESNIQTAQRLDEIFKGKTVGSINYKARLDMIAKTETARIMNAASMKTAKRLGATGKYLEIVNDSRTSEQSKLFYAKYGGKDKAIPIDEEFTITYKGKKYGGQYAPFMPNDRDLVFFTFKED